MYASSFRFQIQKKFEAINVYSYNFPHPHCLNIKDYVNILTTAIIILVEYNDNCNDERDTSDPTKTE